jgi:hypothetical protein
MDGPGLLIDHFMPGAPFGERHQRWLRASPRRALQAAHEVRPEEIHFLLLLSALRSLRPGRLFGQERAAARERSLLEVALAGGFLVLADDPDRELLLGTVGRFWTLRPSRAPRVTTPDEFLAFDEPGYAKATLNFHAQAEGGGCRLVTETRITATDAAARRKFGLYWRLIRPGSGLIRRTWLAAIQRRAEA